MNRRLLLVIQDKRVRRMALLIALWVPALFALVLVRGVLLPFLLAFLLAYVIAPLVRRLAALPLPGGRRLPRWGAVIVLYAAFAGLVWLAGSTVVPRLYREAGNVLKEGSALLEQVDDDNLAVNIARLEAWLQRMDVPVQLQAPGDEELAEDSGAFTVDVAELVQGLVRDAKAAARSGAARAFAELQSWVTALIGFVFKTFLVLMLTAFIAADTERLLSFLFTITPVRDRSQLSDLLQRIDNGLSGVVRGQLTICVINGALTLVGLLILKVKFAYLLATVAAVFSLVPVFGSILSTLPIVAVALSSGVGTALGALAWIIGIHALEAYLLNPKIMGDAARIHPVLVVLALVVGEHYGGIVGALLAVPLMSILATIFKAVRTRAMVLDEEIGEQGELGDRPDGAGMRASRRVRLRGEHTSP
ncbi:MAG: AI-2E family transporter [Deltaproteobacteria bacterium]|nr:AI-2E family transporter [Deltaproteobacteria bacterium]